MDLGNGAVAVEGVTLSPGMGSEQLLDASDWNFDADLNILRNNLTLPMTQSERRKAKDLVLACIRLTQNAVKEAQTMMTESETVSGESKETNSVICNSGINPLEMDLILKMTLGYLPRNELLTCRLVSQSWNLRAVSWFRQKQIKHKEVKPEDFPRFCDDFQKSVSFPLSKLSLQLEGLSSKNLFEFFNKHGPWIEDLVIQETDPDIDNLEMQSEDYWTQQNLKKLQHILKHVPNMKAFAVGFEIIPEIDPGFIFSQAEVQRFALPKVEQLALSSRIPLSKEFLNGLFAILPNVHVVNLGYFGSSNEEQDWEAFASAMEPRSVHTIYSPVHFETPELWTAFQGTQRLAELSLKLEIYPSDDFSLVDAQHEFLKSQSESLEVLTLTNGEYDCWETEENFGSPKLRLPVLTNLKSLSLLLEEDIRTTTETPFRLVRIEEEQVPNLKSLSMDYLLHKRALGRSAVFPSVQELEFTGEHEYWFGTPDILTYILPKFPNLRKLSAIPIILTTPRDMEYLVSSGLESFEELELKFADEWGGLAGFKDVNLVLSGIPVDSAWLLSQMEDHVGREAVLSWIDPPGPSLRDLIGLKRLVLIFEAPYRGDRRMDVAVIDEIGVNVTFLRLPPQLHLTLKGDFSISDNLAAKMTAHFQNVYFAPTPPSAVLSDA